MRGRVLAGPGVDHRQHQQRVGIVRFLLERPLEMMDGFRHAAALGRDESQQRIAVGSAGRPAEQSPRVALGIIQKRTIAPRPRSDLLNARPRAQGNQRRRVTLYARGFVDESDRAGDRVPPQLLAGLEHELEGARVRNRPLRELSMLIVGQRDVQGTHDFARDAFLHLEHIVHRAGVLLGPQLRIVRRIDQLRRDPQAVACLADAAVEDVADAQFPCKRWSILLRPLEPHRRGP